MKKILLVLMSVLILANVSIAQNKYTPHVKGDDAMLFSFSGLGFLAAFIVGLFACNWMVSLVKHSKLRYFAFYCFAVGLISIAISIF